MKKALLIAALVFGAIGIASTAAATNESQGDPYYTLTFDGPTCEDDTWTATLTFHVPGVSGFNFGYSLGQHGTWQQTYVTGDSYTVVVGPYASSVLWVPIYPYAWWEGGDKTFHDGHSTNRIDIEHGHVNCETTTTYVDETTTTTVVDETTSTTAAPTTTAPASTSSTVADTTTSSTVAVAVTTASTTAPTVAASVPTSKSTPVYTTTSLPSTGFDDLVLALVALGFTLVGISALVAARRKTARR